MVRPRKTPDGRANNGGARQGTPGATYGNRSDLRAQKPTAVPGQEYGKATAQMEAQKVVPLAAAPPLPGPASAPASQGPAVFATPEDTPTLTAPTNRPNEPIEAGLAFGPGPGPEALGPPPMTDVEARLRALYAVNPTQELRDLIAQTDIG